MTQGLSHVMLSPERTNSPGTFQTEPRQAHSYCLWGHSRAWHTQTKYPWTVAQNAAKQRAQRPAMSITSQKLRDKGLMQLAWC